MVIQAEAFGVNSLIMGGFEEAAVAKILNIDLNL